MKGKIDTALADRLQGARRAHGWSREQLREHSGVSIDTIARIEGAKMAPRRASLIALGRALGIDLQRNEAEAVERP